MRRVQRALENQTSVGDHLRLVEQDPEYQRELLQDRRKSGSGPTAEVGENPVPTEVVGGKQTRCGSSAAQPEVCSIDRAIAARSSRGPGLSTTRRRQHSTPPS